MSAIVPISRVLATAEPGSLWFECPGCGTVHRIQHGAGDGPRWGWNGDAERPTFTPSILVRWDQWEPPATTPEICEKIKRGEIRQTAVPKVCHSFVTDGQIQFLGDCTHALAGQTVPIPDWDTQ